MVTSFWVVLIMEPIFLASSIKLDRFLVPNRTYTNDVARGLGFEVRKRFLPQDAPMALEDINEDQA